MRRKLIREPRKPRFSFGRNDPRRVETDCSRGYGAVSVAGRRGRWRRREAESASPRGMSRRATSTREAGVSSAVPGETAEEEEEGEVAVEEEEEEEEEEESVADDEEAGLIRDR